MRREQGRLADAEVVNGHYSYDSLLGPGLGLTQECSARFRCKVFNGIGSWHSEQTRKELLPGLNTSSGHQLLFQNFSYAIKRYKIVFFSRFRSLDLHSGSLLHIRTIWLYYLTQTNSTPAQAKHESCLFIFHFLIGHVVQNAITCSESELTVSAMQI